MRTFFQILLFLGTFYSLHAQSPFKQHASSPYTAPAPLTITKNLGSPPSGERLGKPWRPGQISSVSSHHEAISSYRIASSGSVWIEFKQNELWASRSSLKDVLQDIIPMSGQTGSLSLDWSQVDEQTDEMNITHIRVQGTLDGIPIHRQDMILHIQEGNLRDVNGFTWTGPLPDAVPTPASVSEALDKVKSYLAAKDIRFQPMPHFEGFDNPEDEAHLVWYPDQGHLKLAYEVNMHPNIMDHWTVFISAQDLNVIEAYSHLCSFAPLHLYDLSATREDALLMPNGYSDDSYIADLSLADGATMVNDQDLSGQNRVVHAYQVGTDYYMIDASRTGMFNSTQSIMPNEPSGVIWTIDGQNGSPTLPDFELIHVSNTTNDWKNLEVSSHYNGGVAYEYFRTRFNRNSINGSGGNIISIINVRDENGNDMDNAFWNGAAMFYGNGDVAFTAPLAKALDVAGHEMSHGVIQHTANLEYVGQSGALNESYADVFGVLIDRDDWQLGEEVSNPAIFPTGALRDMSNPNNGGTQLGHPGWQPKHMNEYQNLPNTPEGDNGGVHVNSGIPNKAFFLLATAIGKDNAEQIYYRALTTYLVKSSQFIDMRNAVEKSASDLHGAGSAEVVAVRSAFDGVGIGSGQGGNYEEDIEINEGDDFILATDALQSDLYWVPPGNPSQFVKLNLPAPISLPSFTDDGRACVYVDIDHNMIVIYFDWIQGLDYEAFYLEDNPQGIWRNVVVSKDGSKLAYTTSNLRNEISVFDFDSGVNTVYELFNPTSAGGISTGDVEFPDVMEWDYSGEYIMYDALNRLPGAFGNGIEYWDISFLHAWNSQSDSPGTGQIGKLFSALPENISVGNASFAKNSPYIITFDFVEDYFDIFGQIQTSYKILAANIEAGEVNEIFNNNTIGYPGYSRLDDQIMFTYYFFTDPFLVTIDVQPGNKTLPVPGSDEVLITGAQKGVWFATGVRNITSLDDLTDAANQLQIRPMPAHDHIYLSGDALEEASAFTVFDITGNAISSGHLADGGVVPVHRLPPGSYLIRVVEDNGKVHHARFVKH